MTQSPNHPISNPYVGPRTFTYAQRRFFFGREREARDLLARVVSERVLLFYAQSGAGKSSLLQTRLIPQLREEEGFAVLPVGRVSGALPTGMGEVANVYLFNLMASLDQSSRDPQRLAQLSLSRFLAQLTSDDGEHWHYVEAPAVAQPVAEITTPTGGTRSKTAEVVAIAAAAPPTTNGAVHPAEQEQRYALIIDQFEEIITTHPNRWREREEFFRQLNQALLDDRNLWVVLTLREDYVAALDPYAGFMADKLRARFYMERMGVAAALEAVRQPAALAGRPFAAGVAEALVDNLRRIKVTGQAEQLGQYVEPVQLQVVCYQLWEKVTAAGMPAPSITMTDLQQSGDVNSALGDFYNGAVAAVLKEAGSTLTERRLRTWVNTQLITEAGTRGTVYQGLADTAGLPNPIVKRLTDQFLLRSEQRAGGYWVELVHDRFVEPIREANARWQTQYYNPVAAAYQRWQTSGQPEHLLLHDESLREAQRFAASATADLTEDEREFLQRAVAEEKRRTESQVQQQQNQRRNRLVIAATVAATVLAILVTIIGYIAVQARQARADAEKAQKDAVAARIVAEAERQRADEERTRAEEERQSALIQAGNAAIARAKQLAAQAQVASAYDERLLLAVEAVTATYTLRDTQSMLQLGMADESLRQAIQSADGLPHLYHDDAVYDVTFSPDSQWLASASADRLVRLWRSEQLADPPLLFQGHTDVIYDLAFHPNGKILASAGEDETVRLWSIAAPTLPAVTLQGHTDGVARITFSPDGNWLASASTDQTLRLWAVADPTAPSVVLRGHTARVYDAAFSPDSQLLASASQDKTVRIWQVNRPDQAPLVLPHLDGVPAVAFSPDGVWLASASWDKIVRLWHVPNFASPPILLAGHKEAVRTLAFSPDQRWLVTAGNDGQVRVWSLGMLQKDALVLVDLDSQIYDVTFSADSQWLAVAGQNGTTRLWRFAALERAPIVITGQYNDIWSINFSDDHQWLAAASLDFTVQLWPLTPPRLIELACHQARRNFNAAEWARYFGDAAYARTCPQWPIHASIAEAAYQRGKTLAEAGQFTAAIAQFKQAKALDPVRAFDPTAEADRLHKAAQAAPLVAEGRKLAESGDVTGAIAHFTEAVTLDPSLSLDPATEAATIFTEVKRTQAQQVLTAAQTLAKNLDLPGATEKFAEALRLDPTLALEPATEAKRLAAQTLHSRGQAAAQRGDRAAAIADYEAAQRYDPTLALNPQLDVQLAYARGLNARWAPAQAMAALAAAQALSPTLDLTTRLVPVEWYRLCWRGALSNMAAVVMPACETAVAQEPTNGEFRANRGFARALQNDIEGAIADFQFYIDTARSRQQTGAFQQQSAPQQTVSPSVINGYKAWITALRAGVNPIQAYVLTRNGAVDQALSIYRAFHAISPPLQLTAVEWNNLCWYGSLAQRAEQVLYACEWAVTLEPENGDYRDSRGLARALLGDLTGAIEDFEAYLAQGGTTIPDTTRKRRLAWIQAFRASMNPVIAERLTRNGPIDTAIALYVAIDSIRPPLQLTAEEWNNLCWYGSLAVRASKVLFACDRAVTQEPTNGNFHDSRSLARLMTGDITGAIEDLEFALEWAHESKVDQSFILDRRFWLFVLQIAQLWEVKQ